MIHGTAASIGCLAMGNQAAEDLFVLAAWVGSDNMRIVVCPTDFRDAQAQDSIVGVPWASQLYTMLRSGLPDDPRR